MAYKDPQDPRALEARRKHYRNNKEAYLERAKAQRDEIDRWYRQLKNEKPCADCGVCYPYYVMQYDHLGDKEHGVSVMVARGFSKIKIEAEIAKCELVCANCHCVRTWMRSRT